MELNKTSLYSPDDLIELLKTSGAPLSKIAEETAIPEPTLKNYKYGKTLIDSMPYRIVVELSRFFRQYDLNVEKLKSYGHVILPKDIDNIHFEYTFGGEFTENPHLYALRVLHLFMDRSRTFTFCNMFKQEYSFDHVFVAISSEIIDLIAKTNWLSVDMYSLFSEMDSLNITCIWRDSMFEKMLRYFNSENPTKHNSITLREFSVETENLMSEMKSQLFTYDYQLDELEYVDGVSSNVTVQYLLMMFGIDPDAYYFYRRELDDRSKVDISYACDGLFDQTRLFEEYEHVSLDVDNTSVNEMVKFRRFQLQMELYRKFDLEISQKYNFDEILRKGTYEKLFE